MPYKDPEKRKEYRNRPEVKAKAAEADKRYYESKGKELVARRRNILAQFSCISCGESASCAIDWHHINDDTKLFNIAAGVRLGEDNWWNEILKCVPLCSNCHRKLHNDLLCLIPLKKQ